MRQTLSSITGGSAGQLFATYKNILTIIDVPSGSVTKQFNVRTKTNVG